MWRVQQQFQSSAPKESNGIVAKRGPSKSKMQITSNSDLRQRFKGFFQNRYQLDPTFIVSAKNEYKRLKDQLPMLFVEQIEFKGIDSINQVRDIDDRSPEKLKGLLTILEIYFEEYEKVLPVNVQKTHSYFDFLEHLRSLTSEFYEAQIEVKHDHEYMLAFAEILSKKSRLIKSTTEYLNSGNSLSLTVERVDTDKLHHFSQLAEKMSLFEILSHKGKLIRQNEVDG